MGLEKLATQFENWSDTEYEDKKVKELFSIDGLSLWWSIRPLILAKALYSNR